MVTFREQLNRFFDASVNRLNEQHSEIDPKLVEETNRQIYPFTLGQRLRVEYQEHDDTGVDYHKEEGWVVGGYSEGKVVLWRPKQSPGKGPGMRATKEQLFEWNPELKFE